MRKLLVSDYDGTFYLNDEDIEQNKKAVKDFREKGNLFVIATGRSYLDFKNKANFYQLDYDYVILNHGATILDAKDHILSNVPMDDSIIKNLKNDLQLENAVSHFCCSKLESRVSFMYDHLTKINIRYQTKEKAIFIYQLINQKYKDFVHSYYINNQSLEIIANEMDKAKAIYILLEKLQLSKEHVYTIGDGYSDIEMIKQFHGYAMINAVEGLKEIVQTRLENVATLIKEII